MERNERRIIGGNWNNAFSVSSGDEAFESLDCVQASPEACLLLAQCDDDDDGDNDEDVAYDGDLGHF